MIVAFGREGYEYERFREQGKRAIGARIRVTVRQALFSLAVNTTTAIGTAASLGYGTYLALGNNLTVGELLIVVAYIGSVYNAAGSDQRHDGRRAGPHRQSGAPDLLDWGTGHRRPARRGCAIGRVAGHVRFEGVTFDYPGTRGHARRHHAGSVGRPGDRNVGADGRGQEHAGEPAAAVLRPGGGANRLDGVDITTMTLKSPAAADQHRKLYGAAAVLRRRSQTTSATGGSTPRWTR